MFITYILRLKALTLFLFVFLCTLNIHSIRFCMVPCMVPCVRTTSQSEMNGVVQPNSIWQGISQRTSKQIVLEKGFDFLVLFVVVVVVVLFVCSFVLFYFVLFCFCAKRCHLISAHRCRSNSYVSKAFNIWRTFKQNTEISSICPS